MSHDLKFGLFLTILLTVVVVVRMLPRSTIDPSIPEDTERESKVQSQSSALDSKDALERDRQSRTPPESLDAKQDAAEETGRPEVTTFIVPTENLRRQENESGLTDVFPEGYPISSEFEKEVTEAALPKYVAKGAESSMGEDEKIIPAPSPLPPANLLVPPPKVVSKVTTDSELASSAGVPIPRAFKQDGGQQSAVSGQDELAALPAIGDGQDGLASADEEVRSYDVPVALLDNEDPTTPLVSTPNPRRIGPIHPYFRRYLQSGNYFVRPGDTLANIAFRLYGDDRMALEILAANRDLIHTPHDLEPGMHLRLP